MLDHLYGLFSVFNFFNLFLHTLTLHRYHIFWICPYKASSFNPTSSFSLSGDNGPFLLSISRGGVKVNPIHNIYFLVVLKIGSKFKILEKNSLLLKEENPAIAKILTTDFQSGSQRWQLLYHATHPIFTKDWAALG